MNKSYITDRPLQLRLRSAALELLKCLRPDIPVDTTELRKLGPIIILAFDEAHTLDDSKDVSTSVTRLSQLRSALGEVSAFPIFTVCISTTVKIHDFALAPGQDIYGLMTRGLKFPYPYTNTDFDQMADSFERPPTLSIYTVSRVGYMVRLGRPLFGSRYKHGNLEIKYNIVSFAELKLVGSSRPWENLSDEDKLACISVRLALESNAKTMAARTRERAQVEMHMRICMQVDETFMTISPSEPLLAEASRRIMLRAQPKFDMSGALLHELEMQSLKRGDRGELIAETILIQAMDAAIAAADKVKWDWDYDQGNKFQLELPTARTRPLAVPVVDFIKSLFSENWHTAVLGSRPAKSRTTKEGACKFSEAFQGSKIYFTHFIKVDDLDVINRDFICKLIARGAAVVCPNNQRGVDIVIPFVVCHGEARENISAFFFQLKTIDFFTTEPTNFLFDSMDPYFIGFFDINEKHPIPVIRMVFALASQKGMVKAISADDVEPERQVDETSQKKVRGSPAYTAYDIWCAGACEETFGVIKGNNLTYENLLKIAQGSPIAYVTDIPEAESTRRNMNPGTLPHLDHWSNWNEEEMEVDNNSNTDDIDFDGEEFPAEE